MEGRVASESSFSVMVIPLKETRFVKLAILRQRESPDVWPIVYDRFNEVLVESVAAPRKWNRVKPLRWLLFSNRRLRRPLLSFSEKMENSCPGRKWICGGENRISFPVVSGTGQRRFQVQIQPSEGTDSIPLNNAGSVSGFEP